MKALLDELLKFSSYNVEMEYRTIGDKCPLANVVSLAQTCRGHSVCITKNEDSAKWTEVLEAGLYFIAISTFIVVTPGEYSWKNETVTEWDLIAIGPDPETTCQLMIDWLRANDAGITRNVRRGDRSVQCIDADIAGISNGTRH